MVHNNNQGWNALELDGVPNKIRDYRFPASQTPNLCDYRLLGIVCDIISCYMANFDKIVRLPTADW